ncbi:futalosine hydrolase [Tumebacillus flagellatus]|uniref:Futalosine hydrolase n=1 Tax=Tumebacillus flagellatus TaxID=1157490 RepID=A0A074LS08_9BACL|nr:futalosine hydrolase [Tumebacillus flagellatus]KEO84936.1 hypothetical protein EL26_02715 [Tumebacillus flagellatus]
MRVLILTAVSPEREAVLRGLADAEAGVFDVQLAGVGPMQAAINTTKALAAGQYDLVISAGIAGGFVGVADVGSVVISTEIIAADLGAETPDGFSSLDELGFGKTRVPVDAELVKRVTEAVRQTGLAVHAGPILTLSTVTGTAETAAELARRIPGASAEGMEGYGVALAAHERGIPVLELRTISNPVGPRNRAAWKMKEAFAALETASKALMEVLR